MDVTFSNVLEGTRQYFMGLPKQADAGGGGAWPAGEEAARAQSGAPTPTAPPPSAAAAPPPPRPPSEPIEPEPHIIHKATVMREAAEKRRERPDDDEAADDALSPPPHIIRRPELAPAPELRPSSTAAVPPAPSPVETTSRGPTPRGATPVARPPEHFTPARPPDPYSSSRPPEPYPSRYYEVPPESRPPGPLPSPQPPPRHGSPQTYARLSSTLPAHAARLREAAAPSPPAPRYVPAPPCDRVPPLHQPPAAPPRSAPPDARTPHYASLTPRREPSPYSRAPHYERHPALPQRKYDPQQAYPGYRPAPTAPQPVPTHRVEHLHTVQYKHAHAHDVISSQYSARGAERLPLYPPEPRPPLEAARRPEYPGMPRPPADARTSYLYPTPSTSTARYGPGPPPAAVPVVQSPALPARPAPRPPAATAATAPQTYEYQTTNHVPTSPARSVAKPGYPNQQARMTVSVTTLVNQMNQTKQKRESPLDLSVKTVKNSADSSTTQDDIVDSASVEKSLPLPHRPTSSSRHSSVAPGFIESHKVDFAPDFSQYRERGPSHTYPIPTPPGHLPVRYNGAYEHPPSRTVTERYAVESRHQPYPERNKYSVPVARADYVPRIDLTRSVEERRPDTRIRDDRHFIIEERKRPSGPIVSNIPEKIVRYETWTADSRIDRMNQSAREQYELMNQPVYSYSSHKQFEAYQNEQKRLASASAYRDHHHPHVDNRYSYPEAVPRERHDYHPHHHDRTPSSNSRHVIQKIPSHKDIYPHHLDPHSGVPADKRVLSILRNSLETKQTGLVEPARATKQVPDLIVIDDVDDSVIEITDLTKDNDVELAPKVISKPSYIQVGPNMDHHIKMPKAVDSIASDYQRLDNYDTKSSPENDVASRIRTKAELKVMPPSDNNMRSEPKLDEPKILPKSQKQHLFNQIREDQRLESVIKCDKFPAPIIPEVKTEPMNIDEIEKDAVTPIKTESSGDLTNDSTALASDDLDWASACDSFMEQLKSGAHKKKTHRKLLDTTELDNENKANKIPKVEPLETTDNNKPDEQSKLLEQVPVVIKQEPIDEEEIPVDSSSVLDEPVVDSQNKQNQEITENDKKPDDHKVVKPPAEKIRKKSLTTPEKRKEDQEKTKSTTPEKRKCDKEKNKTDTEQESTKKEQIKPKKTLKFSPEKGKEKEKIKKPLPDEKAKTPAKAKKSLSLQEETSTKAKKSLPREEDKEKDKNKLKNTPKLSEEKQTRLGRPKTTSTSKEANNTDKEKPKLKKPTRQESPVKEKKSSKIEKNKIVKKNLKLPLKDKPQLRGKGKIEKNETITSTVTVKKEKEDEIPVSAVVKEEPESTDDDEPLIKSKILKEKEMKYQVLKDLSEKSAYVKLECFDVDLNKNTRVSIDSLTKEKDVKGKTRQASKNREKIMESSKNEKHEDSSSNSDDEIDLSVASRLRVRKNIKIEENKTTSTANKSPVKSTPKKQDVSSASNISTPLRKPGFGDGSDFHPGWEEELYKYKRSLRMPTRLIAIPRGRSGGPFVKGSGSNFNRGSTSLPDLDPAPLSPAPSSAPSAATDDLYARRQDKMAVDSDLESNSSYSATNRLHYDSEASTSTVFSTTARKKKSSIVDVLIQKCGQQNASKKKTKEKDKDDKIPKIIPKSTNPLELLPTPSLGLVKSDDKSGKLSAKKEKLMEDIFYLGAFRKETVSSFRTAFIKNTDGLIGATEEFAPVVLKTRTRTESRVLKQRATIKEVFGDERPASAPPIRSHEDDDKEEQEKGKEKQKKDKEEQEKDKEEQKADKEEEKVLDPDDIPVVAIKKEKEPEAKPKLKPKKIIKDNKLKRRSSSIRDGLRSTQSLKRNDAKGRLLRLKKRNSILKSLANKRPKDSSLATKTCNKVKKEKPEENDDNEKPKEEISTSSAPGTVNPKEEISAPGEGTKRRLKRLFGRRKFSSGFDYIRKKKKIIRREETPNNKVRRPAVKPSPESVHDIQKEIKGWFINKSVGETHLHRAARLGYTDCVAYCLEKMEADPSAKDNAGFTALHVAAAKGHVRIARLLLQYGANVSAAANGGIRPLHEASENCHVEVIRLLLSYGADPLLGTYAGQTPEELTEGPAARFLRLHIADVQGQAVEPWRFPPPDQLIDREELGCDPLSSPPPSSPAPPADPTMEIQCTEMPLPPFYSLKNANGTPVDGLWCLLQDITNILQIKSKDNLLKQIHCGSGSPKELLREIRTQEFLERAQCHQLLCAGEKVNIRASKVSLVRVTDKLRQLLKIETVLIS